MELLVAIAETGSLGGAATALGITQPTVSARVRAMERRLGLHLVDRSPQGSRLTPQGLAITNWARGVLIESDRFEDSVAALRRELSSHMSIAASMTVAEYLVPRWLARLQPRWPEIAIALRVHNSEGVARAVLARECDIGFVEGVHVAAGLSHRTIGRDRLVLVISPAHRWARRRGPITVADLDAARLVLRESGSGTREIFDHAIAVAGHEPIEPALVLGSTAAIKAAVTGSDAVGVVSELAVRDDLRHGELRSVDVKGLDLRRELRAVWPRDQLLTDPADDLLRLAAADS